MLTHPTHERLIALGLTGMAKALEEQRQSPDLNALPFEERLGLLRESLSDLGGVEVDAFDGLLVDFVRKRGGHHILRGIRALTDFEYEYQMALMNHQLAPDIETVFLMPREEFSFLSSRLVKGVALLGGPVEQFVPPPVAKLLKERLRK